MWFDFYENKDAYRVHCVCFRGVACWNSIHLTAHSAFFKLVILPSLDLCSGYVSKDSELKNKKNYIKQQYKEYIHDPVFYFYISCR